VLVAALAFLAAIVVTQEPDGIVVVVAVILAAVVAASAASLALLRTAGVGRSVRARASRGRAVRRGAELGAAFGLIAALQLIGGLTPLTAAFVVLSFAVAEYVLSAGASA